MINLFSQDKRMTNDRVEKYFCASSNRSCMCVYAFVTFDLTLQIFMPSNHKVKKKKKKKKQR